MASLITLSQKYQYALRALYELSLRYSSEKIASLSDIAEKQDIPVRFLELIFAKLKSGGYIQSHRGQFGGYILAKPPSQITLGELFQFLEGPLLSINCGKKTHNDHCDFSGNCVFQAIWKEAEESISKVFNSKSLQNLIEMGKYSAGFNDYTI